MRKTVFLLGFLPNPRMYKRIDLAQKYSDVHLICWDRGKEMLESPEGRGFSCDVISIAAGNDPISRVVPYSKFTKEALRILYAQRPDIIHVQGLDMLQIACKYKEKHKDTCIIYEVADLHRLLVDKQKGIIRRLAQKYLRYSDKKCGRKCDLLIVTSEEYYNTYFSSFIPKEKYFYFPNVPDLSAFSSYKKKTDNRTFTIGYFGVIRYKKELRLLIESLDENNANLIIAGYEESGTDIEELCRGKSDIEWLGRFDFKKMAAELYGRCDCVYAVYDADMANCKVALPNKLYESVYCELPIMVADNTHVGDIVRSWGVGIPVQHDSRDSINEAIKMLKKEELYKEYVKNCVIHKDEVNLNRFNNELKKKIESLFESRV